MKFRSSLALTLSVVVSLAILIGLGTWQVQRLTWKEGLIALIAERMDAAPKPLPQQIDDTEIWRFQQVTVSGTFLHDGEAHRTGKTERGVVGYRIFTPLQRNDGGIVMVERGWVPGNLKEPAARADSLLAGPVTITGVLRILDPRNAFTPDDDPVRNMWFASDPRAMAAAAGYTAPDWYVVAGSSQTQWPRAGKPELNLVNNHLQYAITWYALGAVLLVIWLIMGFKRGREENVT